MPGVCMAPVTTEVAPLFVRVSTRRHDVTPAPELLTSMIFGSAYCCCASASRGARTRANETAAAVRTSSMIRRVMQYRCRMHFVRWISAGAHVRLEVPLHVDRPSVRRLSRGG